jgi:hypothetical protein
VTTEVALGKTSFHSAKGLLVCQRGYVGGPDHFRHRLAELNLRPRKSPEAFFELRTLPGEQAQVDWAHFGSHKVQGGQPHSVCLRHGAELLALALRALFL